jgi:hypothetical protein
MSSRPTWSSYIRRLPWPDERGTYRSQPSSWRRVQQTASNKQQRPSYAATSSQSAAGITPGSQFHCFRIFSLSFCFICVACFGNSHFLYLVLFIFFSPFFSFPCFLSVGLIQQLRCHRRSNAVGCHFCRITRVKKRVHDTHTHHPLQGLSPCSQSAHCDHLSAFCPPELLVVLSVNGGLFQANFKKEKNMGTMQC